VYLPAFLVIVISSSLAAPLGARVAHAMSVVNLKRLFALFIYAMAIRLLLA